ncbi:TIGR03111 family XrtG-associated glycosyltransferase [Lactiplantibacillus pentosus]|uniref:Glycosyltransferase, exosortase G system-associated n=2 Tax=Lactiplantibacillus pentosus TaxID=1589 RepID=A0AAX6L9T5_LACPE|nr:TIGR03111 family XrtG-associated glycosyltransferase [Lactiplantibacillus pentosus]MBU7495393.1 putative glycosyltransferase, exosortase G system-associated [Lactiplantibacillus pentosus]MCC3163082.1 putative glycosyltransferase, exosortase G system-associated [Lactiplantibacillus pentosus]MCJ8188331.1 putative glycosyltransferase, exosortase G system-associated [Lactiplantibacillus pentosus]MCT3298487.1 putative glycosyltransferase, exosortase G system-associated [Lactiplantibacillus pentos
MYWLNLALTRMGFWITWALIPIVVEIIPSIVSTAKLMHRQRRMPKLKAPQKWPWVTIIVPVYNSEDTLFDCIRSIDRQTYPKQAMQIILANNQSTDDSFGAYARAQDAFPNLFLRYVNTDKGKARALNAAIYESIGSYVINIDSDGLLEPNAVKNMVLRFESDSSIAAMTGAVLPQRQLVQQVSGWWHRLLAKNEYYEYAQAFLSGRTIESFRDQLFTMSGAFSAFRREVLMETFLYDTDTIGEDTDMTFQIRTRLGKKVVICANAIFYVEPISGFAELYTQRQRWQRGELEVAQNYMAQTASLRGFFKDFLVRRIMIDHTFTFPRMIWTFATLVLIAFGYSTLVVGLSYLLIYGLYVLVGVINFISVGILLKPYPAERRFYSRLWWLTLTLPIYMFLTGWIRLVGVINAMTTHATWRMRGFSEEWHQLIAVLRDDRQTVRDYYRQRRKEK